MRKKPIRNKQKQIPKESCEWSRQKVLLYFTAVGKCCLGYVLYRKIERMFSIYFSVAVKKAMDAKLCLCLMLIILGTFAVQGAIPKNKKKNPFEVSARQIRECFFDPLMSKFINFFLTAKLDISLCVPGSAHANKETTFSCLQAAITLWLEDTVFLDLSSIPGSYEP